MDREIKSTNAHEDRLLVGHTGGAIGFTSILLLSLPEFDVSRHPQSGSQGPPPICIAILVNGEGASGIGSLALNLAETFTNAVAAPAPPELEHIAAASAA